MTKSLCCTSDMQHYELYQLQKNKNPHKPKQKWGTQHHVILWIPSSLAWLSSLHFSECSYGCFRNNVLFLVVLNRRNREKLVSSIFLEVAAGFLKSVFSNWMPRQRKIVKPNEQIFIFVPSVEKGIWSIRLKDFPKLAAHSPPPHSLTFLVTPSRWWLLTKICVFICKICR